MRYFSNFETTSRSYAFNHLCYTWGAYDREVRDYKPELSASNLYWLGKVPGDLRSPITLRDLIEPSIGLAGPIVRAQSDYTLQKLRI